MSIESQQQPANNPCPVSFSHMAHDYCDGKPNAPTMGEPQRSEPRIGGSTAEGQRQDAVLSKTHELHKTELARLKADYTRELNAKLEQINKQAETIRDERQRSKELREDLEHYSEVIDKREQSLLSALAAIEKHNKHITECVVCLRPIDVDLSLLHERDAEVCKPLVDALELLEYDENGHITAWPTQKSWADALAKVKQASGRASNGGA